MGKRSEIGNPSLYCRPLDQLRMRKKATQTNLLDRCKFKHGDLVNISFKSELLNPYVITEIIIDDWCNKDKDGLPIIEYHVKSLGSTNYDKVYDDEMELHISEVRDIKITQLLNELK